MKKTILLITLALSFSAFSMQGPNEGVEKKHLVYENRSNTCSIYFKLENLCSTIEWLDGPYMNRTASKILVKFFRVIDGKKVFTTPKNSIKIYPWMIMHSHEHGSSPVTQALVSEGVYEVSDIFMMKMMGHWEIRIKSYTRNNTQINISSVGVHLVKEK